MDWIAKWRAAHPGAVTCRECSGLGTVPASFADKHGFPVMGSKPCPGCHGVGSLAPHNRIREG